MKTIDFVDGNNRMGLSLPSNCTIYDWGDIHRGNRAISGTTIKKYRERVKSHKHGYGILGGDQHESISVTDKRFSLAVHGGVAARIDAQRDYIIRDFDPIGDKILWIDDGNHETKWRNIALPNLDVAKHFGCEYAGHIDEQRPENNDCGTMVKAIFPGFRMLDWHGYGSIRSKAGTIWQKITNTMEIMARKMRDTPGADCDIMSCHHFHQLIIRPPDTSLKLITLPKSKKLKQMYATDTRIWIDKKNGLYIVPDEYKYYICCGSALRGYVDGVSTYVEEHGLPATELGCIKITIKNDKIYEVKEEYL